MKKLEVVKMIILKQMRTYPLLLLSKQQLLKLFIRIQGSSNTLRHVILGSSLLGVSLALIVHTLTKTSTTAKQYIDDLSFSITTIINPFTLITTHLIQQLFKTWQTKYSMPNRGPAIITFFLALGTYTFPLLLEVIGQTFMLGSLELLFFSFYHSFSSSPPFRFFHSHSSSSPPSSYNNNNNDHPHPPPPLLFSSSDLKYQICNNNNNDDYDDNNDGDNEEEGREGGKGIIRTSKGEGGYKGGINIKMGCASIGLVIGMGCLGYSRLATKDNFLQSLDIANTSNIQFKQLHDDEINLYLYTSKLLTQSTCSSLLLTLSSSSSSSPSIFNPLTIIRGVIQKVINQTSSSSSSPLRILPFSVSSSQILKPFKVFLENERKINRVEGITTKSLLSSSSSSSSSFLPAVTLVYEYEKWLNQMAKFHSFNVNQVKQAEAAFIHRLQSVLHSSSSQFNFNAFRVLSLLCIFIAITALSYHLLLSYLRLRYDRSTNFPHHHHHLPFPSSSPSSSSSPPPQRVSSMRGGRGYLIIEYFKRIPKSLFTLLSMYLLGVIYPRLRN